MKTLSKTFYTILEFKTKLQFPTTQLEKKSNFIVMQLVDKANTDYDKPNLNTLRNK